MHYIITLFLAITSLSFNNANAEEIGKVSTTFNFVTPNDAIVIEAFDDPLIPGVACHLSRAKTGGFSGAIGLAEDPHEVSIACRQIGPIQIPLVANATKGGRKVFEAKQSVVFKTLNVECFYDVKRNTLVYLAYSTKLINGSPKGSISSVPIQSRW